MTDALREAQRLAQVECRRRKRERLAMRPERSDDEMDASAAEWLCMMDAKRGGER